MQVLNSNISKLCFLLLCWFYYYYYCYNFSIKFYACMDYYRTTYYSIQFKPKMFVRITRYALNIFSSMGTRIQRNEYGWAPSSKYESESLIEAPACAGPQRCIGFSHSLSGCQSYRSVFERRKRKLSIFTMVCTAILGWYIVHICSYCSYLPHNWVLLLLRYDLFWHNCIQSSYLA